MSITIDEGTTFTSCTALTPHAMSGAIYIRTEGINSEVNLGELSFTNCTYDRSSGDEGDMKEMNIYIVCVDGTRTVKWDVE